ncbi:MAG: alpha/beta hydrolase [Legionellaceae bacterium]|nr:alpha/beta hydrolase [Legionellaceae bacterium]
MLKQFALIFCLTLAVTALLLHIFQRSLIYFPTVETPKLQDYHASDMVRVLLRTQDSIELASWYKPAATNQPTILFLHGNAGHIGHRMPLVRQFIQAGFGVFLLEYRGYGGNKGSPTEQGLYEDGRAALQFLHQKDVNPEQIALYGESLGTGVTTKLASENPVCAVILQSPFTSLVSLARYHYPWILIKPTDQFDSLDRMQNIHSPVLVLHGKQDKLVPFIEGLTVYNRANLPKKIVMFEEQSHNDLWDAQGFSEKVIHFVETHC